MTIFRFKGNIGFEDELTGDGRIIQKGALRFAEKMPLMFVRESSGGHVGAVTVGHFTLVERKGAAIFAEGEFIDPEGAPEELADDIKTAILLAAEGHAPGVSMDLSEVSAEFRVAKELIFGSDDEDEDGPRGLNDDDDEYVTLFDIKPDDQIMLFTDALMRGATLVSVPAFKNANLEVLDANGNAVAGGDVRAEFGMEPLEALADDDESAVSVMDSDLDSILAEPCSCSMTAAAPKLVDHLAFEPQPLEGPTPLTVVDGKVFGHIATWGTCHTGFPGTCVTAPPDPTGEYRAFRTSRINTDAGTRAVGVLTVGGGHADERLAPRPAKAHYDDVSSVWAYVMPYEDEHGIAVFGVIADDVDDKMLATALAHPISGDWRNFGSGLELMIACSVNSPGFPVLAASAELGQTALIASSAPAPVAELPQGVSVDPAKLASAVADELERREEQRRLDAEAELLAAEFAPHLELEADRLAAEVMG